MISQDKLDKLKEFLDELFDRDIERISLAVFNEDLTVDFFTTAACARCAIDSLYMATADIPCKDSNSKDEGLIRSIVKDELIKQIEIDKSDKKYRYN